MPARIGVAGWAICRDQARFFPNDGSALQRYAAVFNAAEINSSFHRPHRHATWQRWRASVPPGFKFSVKVPKEISHERRLSDCEGPLDTFVEQVRHLEEALGALLVQLPPSLAFDRARFTAFVQSATARLNVSIACEPRHPSFFSTEAEDCFSALGVARVAADPAKGGPALEPGGWRGLSYFRLHGSPVTYRSSYIDRMDQIAERVRNEQVQRDTWCIFDNTASSAAVGNALSLRASL